LKKEPDDIEATIAREEPTPEYLALQGQEKYEADREKNEAQKVVAQKRQQATDEGKNAMDGETTAEHFKDLAANSRTVADKIRAL
jgi:hypothetical protein